MRRRSAGATRRPVPTARRAAMSPPSEPRPDPAETEPRFPGPGDLDRALALVRYLRAHCPWDQAQTPESLIPHLLEESHEVVDAIRDGSHAALEQELGDRRLN